MSSQNQDSVQATLVSVKRIWLTCGIVSVIALAIAAVLSFVDPVDVNWVVWLRGSVVAVASFLFIAVTIAASRGNVRAYRRMRLVSILAPIGITLIIVAPETGYPIWMKTEQAVVGLLIATIAILLTRTAVRQFFNQRR
jgi:hypothetical protein